MLLVLLAACTSAADKGTDDSAVDSAVQPTGPPQPQPYSEGECPDLQAGFIERFDSAGQPRSLNLYLPDEPQGAPLVTLWHWLGGSSGQIGRVLEMEEWAREQGFIVVAPDSCCGFFDWPFVTGEDASPDLILFDDLVSCLDEQYEVDLERVYATGMSAGGLWSSYLTQHRSEVLAATAPMSGGSDGAMVFEAPSRKLPVLLTWGGATDTIGEGVASLDFHESTLAFSQQLQDEGHWVGLCDHGQGHTIPQQATDYIARFFHDHRWGGAPSYANGLPGDFPEWCSVASQSGGE